MKKGIVVGFIGVQLLLIMLQIHKSSQMSQALYIKQYLERSKKELEQNKQELAYRLNAAKNRAEIKTFAMKNLGMQPIALNQIKKLERT